MRTRQTPLASITGRLTAALLVFAMLAACSPTPTPDSSASPTSTATDTPSPTPTATITPTPTWTPRPTRTATPFPTGTPTISPQGTLTPTLQQMPAGVFSVAARIQNFTPGLISDLYVTPRLDQIILVGSFGLAQIDVNTQSAQFDRFFGMNLGLDPRGRAWTIQPGGTTISVWIDNTRTTYDRFKGWVIPGKVPYTPVSSSRIVAGVENTLWLATATDVRRFDNDYWNIYPATSTGINLPYKVGVQSALTITTSLTTREAWAGSCYWSGQQIVGGGGLRYFDGRRWLSSGFPAKAACILGLHTAPDNTIWVVTDTDLWQLAPSTGSWKDFPFPALPESQTSGYPMDLVISPASEPCPLVRVSDSGGHPLQDIRYCLQEGQWQAVRALPALNHQSLRFLPDGTPLSFEEGKVLQQQPDGAWQTIGEVDYAAFAVGADARVWLVSMIAGRPIVWLADLSSQ